MKREIKFRGRNDRHGWLTGHYFVNRGVHFIAEDGIANPLYTWEDYSVDPETVGQYTGLKDRNGKEIYDGDIIKDESGFPFSENCIVEWDSFYCQYQYTTIGMDSYLKPYDCAKPVILGNIWDTPELLEEKK